jgi:hypothetical protein
MVYKLAEKPMEDALLDIFDPPLPKTLFDIKAEMYIILTGKNGNIGIEGMHSISAYISEMMEDGLINEVGIKNGRRLYNLLQ